MKVNIEGSVISGLELVKEVFAENWLRIEVGASLCVFHQGTKIVDLWGGYQDRDLQRPWKSETLVNVYSVTKGVVTIALAQLHQEGKLDYEAHVAEYWPEFGQAGKENITVSQLLSHQAGLSHFREVVSVEDLYNWKFIINLLEKQEPLWPPGERSAYHPITWGFLAGELIRRISGYMPGEWIRQHISNPLQAEFYLGLPETHLHRVADMIGPNHARIEPVVESRSEIDTAIDPLRKYLQQLSSHNPVISPFKHASSNTWRIAQIPAANGQANARGLATIYGALANRGEVKGVTILAPAALRAALQPASKSDEDPVLGKPMIFSRGFMLNCEKIFGPGKQTFGHEGTRGSTAFADPEHALGFAYVTNQMESDTSRRSRSSLLIDALYRTLNKAPDS